jgi:hypothetical protein
VEFDGTGTENISNNGVATTLTVGANVTVQTGTGNGTFGTSGLINQGLISAQTSGKTITINTTTFTNSGTLQAINGATLNILTNLTTAQLGAFNSTGGTLQISGTLDNTSANLTLSGAGNSLLLTGTIKNGNASIAGGAQLSMTSGTFNVPNLTVGTGGTFHQSGGNITLSTLSQSGGNVSLGGTTQTLYAIPTITITAGTTALTKDAFKVLTTTSLTFGGSSNAWTGGIDLTQNKLIVEATSQTKSTLLANLRNQAFFGRTQPDGILSSTEPSTMAVAVLDNAVLAKATFGNQTVDSNAILISPELLGDANADGHVDLSDLSTVLNNFGSTTPAWTSGNFDNAPTIDLTDLSDVLNNFGLTNPNASDSILSTQSSIPTPEPTTLPLLATAALLLRRHKNREK